jgi:hypothetical protein
MFIQGINTIFTDQMPTHLVFRKIHFLLPSKFSEFCNILTILNNEKSKFIVALRKYLNTDSFYSVVEFFICKDDV